MNQALYAHMNNKRKMKKQKKTKKPKKTQKWLSWKKQEPFSSIGELGDSCLMDWVGLSRGQEQVGV
jgi:hypothetical protein